MSLLLGGLALTPPLIEVVQSRRFFFFCFCSHALAFPVLELAEESEQYCFQIIFHGPNNRTYYLSTESQSNMEQWMKALTCAGYDYMKLMVAELQRQLDEIEGQCREKAPEMAPILAPPRAPPRRQNPFNKPLTTEYASNAGNCLGETPGTIGKEQIGGH